MIAFTFELAENQIAWKVRPLGVKAQGQGLVRGVPNTRVPRWEIDCASPTVGAYQFSNLHVTIFISCFALPVEALIVEHDGVPRLEHAIQLLVTTYHSTTGCRWAKGGQQSNPLLRRKRI